MEKRYQVFLSSTFTDLQDERQAAMRAVLELGHMPAGMELFPADDDDSWRLIQDVIDASDYYVVIVGGRYGSTDADGVGYTEREYEYALSKRKPVIALLHERPTDLPRGRTETEESAWTRLEAFRSRLESNHARKTWNNAAGLQATLVTSLTASMKRHPQDGWVRASEVPSDASLKDVVILQAKVRELEDRLARERTHAPEGTEHLSQGDDPFAYEVDIYSDSHKPLSYPVEASWDEIFAAIAPTFINEASESAASRAIEECLERIAAEVADEDAQLKDLRRPRVSASKQDTETCLIQFRALGLIRESIKKRSVSDTRTYWMLTPFGDHRMTQLRALRSSRGRSTPEPQS